MSSAPSDILKRMYKEFEVDLGKRAGYEKRPQSDENYKSHLKSELKLNLRADDMNRSSYLMQNDVKDKYSELCRNNITEPVEVSNVPSILKSYIKDHIGMKYRLERKSKQEPSHLGHSESKMSFSIRKYNESNHSGTISNYRKSVKQANSVYKIARSESEDLTSDEVTVYKISGDRFFKNKEDELVQKVFFSDIKSAESKDREIKREKMARIERLRESSSGNIRTNLNKLTVLQPFEDTKILINIDKVPASVLSNLLGKENKSPLYYCIPPARPARYFSKINLKNC
jgi:chaperonin cofactor prefoldin